MKIKNILANVKSKSLKEARDEIDEILIKLESEKLDFNNVENEYKRLIELNKYVEGLFKKRTKEISNITKTKIDDQK